MSVAIVGTGNILMRDEGVGVRVIEELQRREKLDGAHLFDAGTAIMDIWDELMSFDRVIIVDAVRGGQKPGTIYKFKPEDIGQKFESPKNLSLHQISLLEIIAMEKLSSGKSPDITIIGIEPEIIETGLELSPAIKEKVSLVADMVLKETIDGINGNKKD